MRNPFRYFNSSPEVIHLAVMMYIRYPLSLRPVEDLLFERGMDIRHETVRYWWTRFDPMFAAAIRKRRIHHRSISQWRWRAVDHEGEVQECKGPAKIRRRPRFDLQPFRPGPPPKPPQYLQAEPRCRARCMASTRRVRVLTTSDQPAQAQLIRQCREKHCSGHFELPVAA